MLQELTILLLKISAFYFLGINLIYGCLMYFSWRKIKTFTKEVQDVKDSELPGVSFIVPAYNEETLIVETIQTYLSLSHIKKEIIIINDGSHDKTMQLLKTMFQLMKVEGPLYQSITWPELRVLEAPHTGKARALNLGVSYAKFDLICTMDADTIPVASGIEACLKSFVAYPKLIASGGVIQVLNSRLLQNNSPSRPVCNLLTSFQRLEYLRTFVCERLGWSYIGSTLLISGAFCMVKKEAIQRIGGFSHRSITEDFELIVRLRKTYKGDDYQFKTLPLTTCYTQVPQNLRHLFTQRTRWQLGLVQTLFQNRSLFMHPGYGLTGLTAVPYFFLVEALSPLIEFIAFILVPLALVMSWISPEMALFYLGLGILYNLLLTLCGIYLDHKSVTRQQNWSYLKSSYQSILFHFGYKQILSIWRLMALLRSFKKLQKWGDKPRVEIIHQNL